MTMMSKEMVEALRHCAKFGTCQDCPNNPTGVLLPFCSVLPNAADVIEQQQSELESKEHIIKCLQENSDANYRMWKYWEDVAREHWDSINVLAGEMCRLQQEVERLIQEDVELRRARLEGNV